jgi:MoxR-like ATPase
MSSDVVTLRKDLPGGSALPAAQVGERARAVGDAVERVVQGKRPLIDMMLAGVLAKGHLLIEDVPGVGKTTVAQALARGLGLTFSRIQVTSDLLPSDILGVNVFDQAQGKFYFRQGPIFANVVLADEVNRTTPRTQSALLEAMSESQVSLDGTTHRLPQPFLVLATQNPREHAGTYPLPESQLDRFLMRLSVGYPSKDVERQILLNGGGAGRLDSMAAVVSPDEVIRMQAAVPLVHVDASIADYAMRLIEATRESPLIALGVSTRGALAFLAAAQAHALLDSRDFVLPDDVKAVAIPCLAHRIVPAGREAEEMDRREAARVIQDLLDRVALPED